MTTETYCLACNKPGHLTTDCHSTHGLNTPAARELFRLVRAASVQAPEGGELPPLPHPLLIAGGGQSWFSADQMHAYARAALAAQPQAPAWQPIETAPKDGNHLILAMDGKSFIGVWLEIPFKEYRDMDGFYTGQQDADAYWMCIEDGDECEPTHWMPLPAAPQTQEPTNDR